MSNYQVVESRLKVSGLVQQYLDDTPRQMTQIHSVFPNGFHLQRSGGELIYVSGPGKFLSAFGAMLDQASFDQLKPSLAVGQRVQLGRDRWVFYTRPVTYQVDLTHQTVQDLSLAPYQRWLDQAQLQAFLCQLQATDLISQSGFNPTHPWHALDEAWQAAGLADRLAMIPRMIGAGMGLTPSGDDFLTGYLMMAQLTQVQVDGGVGVADLFEQALDTALKTVSTTDVSRSYYRAILAGQMNEGWHHLFHKMMDPGAETDYRPEIQQLQAYGKTSGSDTLLGVQSFLETYLY